MRIIAQRPTKHLSNKIMMYACIAAILIIVPTGYGYWTDKIQIANNITTGYCDLAFTNADIINPGKNDQVKIQKQNEHDKHKHGNKQGLDAGNRLHINVNDAESNIIKFTITNYGTAPAVFSTQTKTNQPLNIKFTNFSPKAKNDSDIKVIVPPHSSKTGNIILEPAAKKEKNYNILIDLKSTGWTNYAFEFDKEVTDEKQ